MAHVLKDGSCLNQVQNSLGKASLLNPSLGFRV